MRMRCGSAGDGTVPALMSAAGPSSDGFLVHDALGKLADVEQAADAAHRLRMPDQDEAARAQAVEQALRRLLAGEVVEVDQHVAAEDHVDGVEARHRGTVADI